MSWMDDAACRGVDPNVMQPDSATLEQVAEALAVCEFCPVKELCHAAAVSQREAYGIWGGVWWGDPPARPAVRCEWCRKETAQEVSGRPKRYCGGACRVAAARARQAVSKMSA